MKSVFNGMIQIRTESLYIRKWKNLPLISYLISFFDGMAVRIFGKLSCSSEDGGREWSEYTSYIHEKYNMGGSNA